MTVLTLTRLWINRLDTGEAVSAMSDDGRSQAWTTPMDNRRYASGRIRSVSVAGEKGEMTWRLVAISQAVKDQLRSWATITVQVRDHRGQKFFGTFDGVTVTEYKQPDLYAAGFTLQTVTFTEGV